MASIYTHNRFGLLLREKMSGELKEVATKYDDLYRLGQQGPDIFFFNLKLTMKEGTPGMFIHEASGKDYLEHIKPFVKQYPLNSPQGAYLVGSLCHYILDSKIHPLVDDFNFADFGHLDIETELDRYYLIKDGIKKPEKYRLDLLIPQTEQVYQVVPEFYLQYNGVSKEDVIKGIKGFSFIKKLFLTSCLVKEKVFCSILKIAGMQKFSALMMRQTPLAKSQQTNPILAKCYDDTLMIALDLIENALGYIYNDQELKDDFNINYDGIRVC